MKTTPYIISEDNRFLIISANSGGRGFAMGRIVCCHEDVYWYVNETNGKTPWDHTEDHTCTERKLAKNHFDRVLPCGNILPMFGERVSRFWDNEGWIFQWQYLIKNLDLPDKKLVYISHDSPKEIRSWFPNSTIINIFDDDSFDSSQWHLKTSANYRIDHHFSGMKPMEVNRYQGILNEIIENKENAMTRDIWLYSTFQTLDWDPELTKLYEQYEQHRIRCENKLRQMQTEYCDINITWKTLDIKILSPLLGKLDCNYDKVLRNSKL